jgi:hypothetical protein
MTVVYDSHLTPTTVAHGFVCMPKFLPSLISTGIILRGHLKIKNYKFEKVGNFKYLGVILHKDNNHQIHSQERIKNANKTYFMQKKFSKIKT